MLLAENCASSMRYNVIGNRASPGSPLRPFTVEAYILRRGTAIKSQLEKPRRSLSNLSRVFRKYQTPLTLSHDSIFPAQENRRPGKCSSLNRIWPVCPGKHGRERPPQNHSVLMGVALVKAAKSSLLRKERGFRIAPFRCYETAGLVKKQASLAPFLQ
jgi:hypothetical protein